MHDRTIRFLCLATAAVTLAACDGGTTYRTSIEGSGFQTQIAQEGLISAIDEFLGPQPPGGLGDRRNPNIEADRKDAATLTARVRAKHPLRGRFSVIGDMALSHGRATYNLPEGEAILTDPALVKFNSTAINTSIGLAYTTQLQHRFTSEYSAGVGHRVARTNTKIASDLLSVDTDSTDSNQHVFAGVMLSYEPDWAQERDAEIFAEARVKYFRSRDYDARVSVGIGFHH